MRKSNYKRMSNPKANSIQWDLGDRKWICLSTEWKRWAKKYLNRATRRDEKGQGKKDGQYDV